MHPISRPTENSSKKNPEFFAAQGIPGYFLVVFSRKVALIFYRDIDCQRTNRSREYIVFQNFVDPFVVCRNACNIIKCLYPY